MNWRTLSSFSLLLITAACGQSVHLNQASDLPSTHAVTIDSSQITLQGQFLNRVKKIRLLSENVDMMLNIQTQTFHQIVATPSQLLNITLGKTYNFFISSAEADTTESITFVINPKAITPDLLDRPYVPATGGTFSGPLSVSGLLTATGGLTVSGGSLIINTTTTTCALGAQAAGNFTCTSDSRLKQKIKEIPQALQRLSEIRGIYYQWNPSFKKDSQQHIGVIAQEVEKQFPELVSEIKTEQGNYRSVDYAGLVAPLIQAVKELHTQTKDLQAQIKKQEKITEDLRQEIQQLKTTQKSSQN